MSGGGKGRGEGESDSDDRNAYRDVSCQVLREKFENRPRTTPWRSGTHLDIARGQKPRQVAQKMIRCLDVTETYTRRASKSTSAGGALGPTTTAVDTSRNVRKQSRQKESLPTDDGVSSRNSGEVTWH